MGEKFLNSTILTYILSKIKDLLSTKADKTNVDNLIDGTTAAGKATKDAEGNVIHETYVTEEQLEEIIGQGGGGGVAFNGDASNVNYDNTFSGLMATDVQTAIDELALGGGSGGSVPDGVTYVSFDESGEHTGTLVPLNADTLGGHPVDYFATAESLEDLNIDLENVDGLVFVEGNIVDTDNYVPINADTLGGHDVEYFATVESVENLNSQAKTYTDTEVASALAEAKAYADSLVNGILNGVS